MKPYAVGIDIGGTKIVAGLVDRDGQVLTRYHTRAHSEQQPEFVIEAVVQAYDAILEQSQVPPANIEAVGLGFGGNTNGPAGLVLVSSNLPAWNYVPLRDIVSRRLNQPVTLDNDTNLAALAEHRYGAGRGAKNMGYVTFSTGYGMGLIINHQLYVGHLGTAGEIGHAVIEINGPLCTCGKRGCLMAYASGVGISRMAYEQIDAGVTTLLRETAPRDRRRITGEMVAEAARQGDEVAIEILRKAGYYAGVGLSIVIQIINPELIIFGGGLTWIGSLLLEPAMAGMRENTQPELLDSVRVIPCQLGDDLVIIGAAAQVFSRCSPSI
jgi:glucokinase